MLPPDRHELACRLFCRMLHRLEERERTHEQHQKTRATDTDFTNTSPIMERQTPHRLRLSSVSPREHTGTKEKRVSRNAAG